MRCDLEAKPCSSAISSPMAFNHYLLPHQILPVNFLISKSKKIGLNYVLVRYSNGVYDGIT